MEKRIILLLMLYAILSESYAEGPFEDERLDFIGLATKFGHKPKEYVVTTKDGYILKLFRIMGVSKTPILLMHGLFDTADTWVLRGNTSLAITLANLGYDVWVGNCRGNRYARNHTYLDPSSKAFWDFTFHESGYYDLPAIIDAVLLNKKAKKVIVFGHSQGNTIIYVLLTTRPEYNRKIEVVVAMAPVCFLNNIPPPLKYMIALSTEMNEIANVLNIREVLGDESTLTSVWRAVCPLPVIGYPFCIAGILMPVTGYDLEELDDKFLPTLVQHFPSGSSVKKLYHYAQVSFRRKFAQYDYGEQINMAIYNSPEPPEYDLSMITVKVVLLSGYNDKLATVEDVAILEQKLPNVQHQLLPRRKMNHADFVWGLHMNEYLYPYIFNVLHGSL